MEGHCHLFSDLKWPISDILHLFLNTFKAELLVVKKKTKMVSSYNSAYCVLGRNVDLQDSKTAFRARSNN